jgi:hypothetical protein
VQQGFCKGGLSSRHPAGDSQHWHDYFEKRGASGCCA